MTDPIKFLVESYTLQLWEKDMNMGDPQALKEIGQAVQKIDPSYYIDWGCGSCLQALMGKASQIKKDNLKFYTFNK